MYLSGMHTSKSGEWLESVSRETANMFLFQIGSRHPKQLSVTC